MISDRMYRQPVLIYNPYAGKIRRNRERILQRTIAALGRAGIVPQVLPTDAAGHATELARAAVVRAPPTQVYVCAHVCVCHRRRHNPIGDNSVVCMRACA